MTKKDVLYLLFLFCLKYQDKIKKADLFDVYDYIISKYDETSDYDDYMFRLNVSSLAYYNRSLVLKFTKMCEKFAKICK